MKVAYLTNQYPKVSHTFIRREIRALEARGISVERFSIRATDDRLVDPADLEEQARTHVILSRGVAGLLFALLRTAFTRPARFCEGLRLAWSIGRRSDRGVLRHFAYLAEACLLAGRLRSLGVEHLHAHFGTNPAAVALLCRALGGPKYSFTVHGPEEFDRPEALCLREKIRRADAVVAISNYGRSQLYRWCDYDDWPRIHVVRCGVDEMFLGASVSPVPDVPKLVCVGRLCEQKGQLLLVEAAAKLCGAGVACQLILVGDGPFRQPLESLARQLGISDRITITGWKSSGEVRDEIVAARGLVLPSFAEGLPVVIMEALALGRPVISTYVAGIPELVVPGECGWLIPAGSVDRLADAMREALETPVDQLSRMGATGAARVNEQHSAAREAAKLAELFKPRRPPELPREA